MVYSGSFGSLNRPTNLMLPCPNCGYPEVEGTAAPPGRFEAVSSGGNRTRVLRKNIMFSCVERLELAKFRNYQCDCIA